MAVMTIAEIIRQSEGLFGLPSFVAAGGLAGRTGSLDPAVALEYIQDWLDDPTAGTPPDITPDDGTTARRVFVGATTPVPTDGFHEGDLWFVLGSNEITEIRERDNGTFVSLGVFSAPTNSFQVIDFTDDEWPLRVGSGRVLWRGGTEGVPPPEYDSTIDIWILTNANVDVEIATLQSSLAALVGTVNADVDALGNRIAALEDGSAIPATGGFQRLTVDGTFAVPAGVTLIRRLCVQGPGGGGGGAGSAAATQLQTGGGGGGAGGIWDDGLDVQPGDTLECVIGQGGLGGAGGAAGGNPGVNGNAGTQTTVTHKRGGTIIETITVDVGGPGTASAASSTTQVNGGMFSRPAFVSTNVPTHPGAGGLSAAGTTPMARGLMGGTGGGTATSALGGNPGKAATPATNKGCYSLSAPGASSQSSSVGADGQTAAVPGCGGGGGGAGAAGTGKGGNGGNGANGLVEIWW